MHLCVSKYLTACFPMALPCDQVTLSDDVYLEGCAELGIEPVTPTPVPLESEVS